MTFVSAALHRDHGTNQRVWTEWIDPLRVAWATADLAGTMVPVVPVTEMETWLLADGDALRYALGVAWSDRRIEPAPVGPGSRIRG